MSYGSMNEVGIMRFLHVVKYKYNAPVFMRTKFWGEGRVGGGGRGEGNKEVATPGHKIYFWNKVEKLRGILLSFTLKICY